MLSPEMKKLLRGYLDQDAYFVDVTSKLLSPAIKCTGTIRADAFGFLAGAEEAAYIFRKNSLDVVTHKRDGSRIWKGDKILTIKGRARKMLAVERVALNVMGRMSAVTTVCRKARDKCRSVRLSVTRKTNPGFQLFDKKAALIGGVWSHRKNLNEMILIKDNHLECVPARQLVGKARKGRKLVEVEASTQEQALGFSELRPDMLMLDNFSAQKAKETIKKLRKSGFSGRIELSGGITLKKLSKYCRLGADIISMGELTKKAGLMDFSLEVKSK